LEDLVYMGGYVKIDLRNGNGMMWTGLIWLSIGTNGRLLWRQLAFGSHKKHAVS
jgi:hypothetical protein